MKLNSLVLILAAILVVGTLSSSLLLARAQESTTNNSNSSIGVNNSLADNSVGNNALVANNSITTGADNALSVGQEASISLTTNRAEPGATIGVAGTNFDGNSSVSIYMLSVLSALKSDSSDLNAFLLQPQQATTTSSVTDGIDKSQSNSSASQTSPESRDDLLGQLVDRLGNMFGGGGVNNSTDGSSNNGNNPTNANPLTTAKVSSYLLLAVNSSAIDGNANIACDNVTIASGSFNQSSIANLAATPGTYHACTATVTRSDDSSESLAFPSDLTVAPYNVGSFENSKIASADSDAFGSFVVSFDIPSVQLGQYAVIAASNGNNQTDSISLTLVADHAAFAPLSVVSSGADSSSNNTVTSSNNSTTPLSIAPSLDALNETQQHDSIDNNTGANNSINSSETNNSSTTETLMPPATTQENSTAGATSGTQDGASKPTLQLPENDVEPGSSIPISGKGFAPNSRVSILINNIQVTNIITNVQGSFNSVVIVPTTVNSGNANISVKTGQINNISQNINIIAPSNQEQPSGPATLKFTSVSASNNANSLSGAPVTIFDASTGKIVESGKTPLEADLAAGTYSVFYSNFKDNEFVSAEPWTWTKTSEGGSGLIIVTAGKDETVTAMYEEKQAPTGPSTETPKTSSITLKATDTSGNPLKGMFVTTYDASTGSVIKQGFTELRLSDIEPGTYPIFFANFGKLEFVSASPGDWIQTPFGGVGLVSIPDDGKSHDVTVTAVYERQTTTTTVEEQSNIKAPFHVTGDIFSITSNMTRPTGPFILSGSFDFNVDSEGPLKADLRAYMMSVRDSSNPRVELDSQASRDHDTFEIVDFKPQVAGPIGQDSYLVSGTADLLLDGTRYSNDEIIQVLLSGGDQLTPSNIEIQFQGDEKYSAAHRLETISGVVTSGFE